MQNDTATPELLALQELKERIDSMHEAMTEAVSTGAERADLAIRALRVRARPDGTVFVEQ